KELVEACEKGVIKYDEKKHKLTLAFGMCNQCMDCIEADKEVGCLQLNQENFSLFQELMAINANEILKTFDEDKRFFLNFLLDITPYCDCWGLAQPAIMNDIGILGSRDIVAVEQATLDLIGQEEIIESMVPPFIKLHKDTSLHPFQRISGPMKSPYIQVEYAEKLGMGSTDYKLIEVLPPEKTAKKKGPSKVTEPPGSFF
ncbi:MAG: DUF362 domain-containing protein, partial [Promethearchaeota archaeon]